ncbi:MAG: hypothetical protein ACWGQW_05205 [bacterium]
MQAINKNQKDVLKKLSDGKQHTCDFDKRTVGALVRRDFIKLISNKKGDFVKITAKGKKELN